ncbi:MAG TPA: DUF2085 domain-containing protein [Anaerolineales bacterium]|nr:DUF2085 domain-containing protein [Anaerolineales bacterium]
MSVITMNIPSRPKRFIVQWIGDHWFETFLILYGLWVFTPFLAPVFMEMGWTDAGNIIYFVYFFFCHQLPGRSLFFFGEKSMYSLSEIQAAWHVTVNPLILRQFVGNETMGWKIAWSDRMISFYTSVWVFAVIWFPFRRKLKPLAWWGVVLLLLPILMDGGTHAISDLAGIGQGFRDTNVWLAVWTNYSLPAAFYAGDALGSFNSFMRFVTGLVAGLGLVWLAFPHIYQMLGSHQSESK